VHSTIKYPPGNVRDEAAAVTLISIDAEEIETVEKHKMNKIELFCTSTIIDLTTTPKKIARAKPKTRRGPAELVRKLKLRKVMLKLRKVMWKLKKARLKLAVRLIWPGHNRKIRV
jgi:hypothetical protein